ncbi:EamA family transporter [Demequina sp. NBRC 110052]|uniref:EamA family transporter n=1 Tax=Demequina sp. NBRC 110052 TaxID=1570341 RepID=UPI0009FCE069|nr:EamA family transporter [Demequina sp. NBRC 110052]
MNDLRMLASTAGAPLLWGTTYLVTATLLPPDQPLTAAVLRALPAGLLMLALSPALPRGIWWWRSAVLGAVNIGVFFGLLFVAAYRLPGGVAATLSATHPLVVAALAAVFLHEAFSRRKLLSALLGLVGVAMLVLGPAAQLDALGAIAAVGAGASSAVGVILVKRWGRPVGLMPFTAWQLVWGGLILLPFALAIEGTGAALTLANVAGYAWMAIPGTVIAQLLWFRGIQALPASRVSLLVFLTPLTATFLGWAVLKESMSPTQWLGAAVVLASVALVAVPTRARPARMEEGERAPASAGTKALG